MSLRLRAYLTLCRPANVCTAIADVTAGALYMGARADDGGAWALLAVSSAMLYAGGAALNDVCDIHRDADERPERPLPSGQIRRGAALLFSITLLMGGVVLAGVASRQALTVAGALVACIVLYDAAFKTTWLGPMLMGLCRALNLALGMTIIPTYRTMIGLIPVLLFMGLFVTSITVLARTEHATTARTRIWTAGCGLTLSILGLGGLLVLVPGANASYLIGVGVLLMIVIGRCTQALRSPDATGVQQAVTGLVLSLVLFDACLVWAARGFTWALVVLVWLVPAKLLAKAFRVT